MPQTILLRGAKQLVTLRGPSGVRRGAYLRDLGIIEDGSVLIRDGLVVSVGSTRRIENLKEARNALEISASGRVAMPGLVDASMSLSMDGLGAAHHRRLSAFQTETLDLLRSCLSHGTLAADIKATANAAELRPDVSILRKLAKIGSNPVRLSRTWKLAPFPENPQGHVEQLQATFEVLARRRLVHSIEFTANGTPVPKLAILGAARIIGIRVKLFWPGGDPDHLSLLLSELNPHTVSSRPGLSEKETHVLAHSPAIAVFPAGREAFEGSTDSAARRLVDEGGALALSSGYDSLSVATFSMQMALALAVFRFGLTAEEAICAATINAAHALGCGHLTGSIEYGKQADILVMNASDYREIPRQYGINHVEIAMREGSVVLNRTRWKGST